MSEKKLFISILLGTVREGRQSEYVARYIYKKAQEHSEIETQLFDPREMDLPMDDDGQRLKFKNPEYRNAIMRADALIIVSPEYNRSFPGSLKRMLDILLTEYTHRAVGLVGVSAGGFGGARAVQQLLPVVRELGLVATSSDLYFSKVGDLFDDDGNITDENMNERVHGFLDELAWMARSLAWGRANLESQFVEKFQKLEEEWQEKMDTG